MLSSLKLILPKVKNSSFFKSSTLTSAVRGGGMFVNLLLTIFISKLISAEGLGLINLSNQIINIIIMIVLLGFQTVIVKETAIAKSRSNLNRIHSVIYSCIVTTFPLVIGFYVLRYFFGDNVLGYFFDDSLISPFNIISSAIVFQIFSRIFSSVLNGVGKVWQSSLVDESLNLLIVLVLIGILYTSKATINIVTIAACYLISRIIVFIVIYIYWRFGNEEYSTKGSLSKKYVGGSLLKAGLPLLFVQATHNIANSIDTIMIGGYLTPKDVGIYSIAYKLAFVSSFILQITNAVLAPRIASMYANDQIPAMQKMISKVNIGLFIAGAGSFLVLVLAGKFMLRIWGSEFDDGYIPLLILGVGQFINVITGCVGLIITLCGQEKAWGVMTLISAIANTLLNILLINFLGIIGAALATATTMALLNIFGVYFVKKRVGVSTMFFLNRKK
ncbi:oligosaccharide flippase family protein [Porifericola rhodea]|uniref:lipopolysaccharide biosynthesis protein n=1 Tax=Porifericola rhodea TaxID=930972 RepID=UPI0026660185|nr:oligosaccharide flippase family protein [Porifericola rhodea]WKN32550.1 oligosaccharide flippase family protein [Porifericola rhodea]